MQEELLWGQSDPAAPHSRQSVWYVLVYFWYRVGLSHCDGFFYNIPILLFIQSSMEKCRGGNDEQKYFQKTFKGKFLDSCVVPTGTYGFETLALSELHEHKLQRQVCENNWLRRIAGVRRVERRRMKDPREEV